ncbi:MAG: ATP-binding protein [Candidatus Babeliales bacterium]
MKNEFIDTENTIKFNSICAELEDALSLIGPSLAMITGAAGRGKTEAAKHYAVNSSAVYIPPMNVRSPTMLLQEITFELAGLRPARKNLCLAIIGDEMSKNRRLIMIDEADLIEMRCLEMLRNINEDYSCPIMLIGEDSLKGRIYSRPRIKDRTRCSMEFMPPSLENVAFYFKRNFSLTLNKDVCAAIHKHGKGTFRRVVKFAVYVEQAMQASNVKDISPELAQMVINKIDEAEKKNGR